MSVIGERERRMEQGLIHVYCGSGKGKTTAATGLALRCAGAGGRVLFARFLKDERSSELNILDYIPEIEVVNPDRAFGFYHTLGSMEREELQRVYKRLWETLTEKAATGMYAMFVVDEFMAAYRYRVISREAALYFLNNKPRSLEVVLTGREPAREILEIASYISEIKSLRHPYEQGVKARAGIEF